MRYVESLNAALRRLLEADPSVVLVGEDLIDPYGGAFKVSKGLSTSFPDRVRSTPISEAAITAVATGAALRGMRPIVEIMFADFLGLTFDQLLNHATKYRSMYGRPVPVPLVIRTPVGGRRGYGPTHSQCPEKHFVGIPGLTVVAPSEVHDPGASLEQAVASDGPVLFLEGKVLYPKELVDESSLASGDWRIEREPTGDIGHVVRLSNSRGAAPDVVVVTYGSTFEIVRDAADRALLDEELTTEICMIENLTAFRPEQVPSARRAGGVLVLEEGTGAYGIGTGLAFALQAGARGPVRVLSARDTVIPTARHLEDRVLPQSDDVLRVLLEMA